MTHYSRQRRRRPIILLLLVPLVAVAAGLGTLNHTALTLEALAVRKLTCAGVVIGCWPDEPGLAEVCNLDDLETLTGQPVAGILPAGAGGLGPAAFSDVAARGLGPALGGTLDAAGFRRRVRRSRTGTRLAHDC